MWAAAAGLSNGTNPGRPSARLPPVRAPPFVSPLVPSIKHIFNELHYEMTRKIAEGGMGVVYEANQMGSGKFRKVVAVKLIREEYSAIEEFQNNFIGEARLVADLIHTNIVQTYHLGQVGGQYFMVMEFVRGVNLEQFL
jgi:serine/threonine protein kinase